MKRNKKNNSRWWTVVAAMFLSFAVGCTPAQDDWDSNASISITKSALRASDVAYVKVSVSGEGITTPIQKELTSQNDQWQGLIESIPAGQGRKFVAVAFDSNDEPLFEGTAKDVELLAGKTAAVMITLQQKVPPNPFHNTVPMIDTVTATAMEVSPNEVVSFRVTAHDEDNDDKLTYSWTAQSGSFDQTNTTSAKWTAPQTEGSYRVTITVSDNHGATIVVSMVIKVVTDQTASAEVTATFNTWPQIQSMYAEPGRVNRGEPIALRVVAGDLDGDSLKYEWTVEGKGCDAGTFTDNGSESPIWMAPNVLPTAERCSLKVKVSDNKGGETQGTIVVQLGEAIKAKVTGNADTTAPTSSVNPPDGTPVPFILKLMITCKDEGSGCSRIVYTLDGTTPSFDPPNGVITDGATATVELFTTDPFKVFTLKFASEDKAGNREYHKTATFPFYQ